MSLRSTLALVAASALTLTVSTGVPSGAATATVTHRAMAPSYVVLKGGATTLTLDPGTAKALSDNHISVAPVSEARVTSGGIAFPVQGGLLNAKTLAGKITHSGGLMFSAGGKDLTIRDFTINTSAKTLTAWVDQVGKRLTVLDLKLGHVKVMVTKRHTTISNVKAVLDPGAANALNAYYGTTLFTGGLKIGTAKVSASSVVLKR